MRLIISYIGSHFLLLALANIRRVADDDVELLIPRLVEPFVEAQYVGFDKCDVGIVPCGVFPCCFERVFRNVYRIDIASANHLGEADCDASTSGAYVKNVNRLAVRPL